MLAQAKKCGHLETAAVAALWGSPPVPFGRHPEPGFRVVAFLPLQVRLTKKRSQRRRLWAATDANAHWFKEWLALANTAGNS